jgi:hypothetical protein
MVHAALLLLMLGARTTVTPFHHQPEAQHPKFLALNKNAGRLPHLLAQSGHREAFSQCPLSGVKDVEGSRSSPHTNKIMHFLHLWLTSVGLGVTVRVTEPAGARSANPMFVPQQPIGRMVAISGARSRG